METKAAPTPAAKALASAGGTPRRARRAPFSAVAPTMTGSATWRESALASARSKPRSARGGQRHAVARGARHQRARLRHAERERVDEAGLVAAAPGRARCGRRRPSPPSRRSRPDGDRRRRAQAPLDRALERVADDRRRHERAEHERRAAVVEAARGGRPPRRAGRPAAPPPCPRAAPPRRPCAARGRARRRATRAATARASVWAEEEIGSSSVGPCRTPSASAWRSSAARR